MFRAVVLALLIVAVSADLAPLLSAKSPTAIKGSYIVVLKDGITLQQRDAHILHLRDSILNDVESKVEHVYGMKGFMGFAARLSEQALKKQLAHPNVKYIEADQTVSLDFLPPSSRDDGTVTQTGATWGLVRTSHRELNLTAPYVYNKAGGEGVDVYVIDTGIMVSHEEFEGRAEMVFNAITNEPSTDGHGHGTHCSGTVGGKLYGIAKNAHLKGVKVLNMYGSGTLAQVILGVNYVADNFDHTRHSVGSMSLGGGVMQTLDDAVTALIGAGVQVVIAAGNSNANACNFSPARTAAAVTVGATTNTDARASYSNVGGCVDIFAPGSSVTSAWIGSNTATNTISGTSMACPHVAGVLAMRHSMADGNQSPAQLKSWVLKAGTPDKVGNPGIGSPNLLLYSPLKDD